MRFLEEGREWRLTGLLYADDIALCGELKEDLRAVIRQFFEVCRRSGLKYKGGRSKMMLLNGEERLECEIYVDGVLLVHTSEFKYLGGVLDESDNDEAVCSRKVTSGRRVAGAIKALVNAIDLNLSLLDSSMKLCFNCFYVW